MTELLATNPKAKDRALARRAIEDLGPSPVAEGTLRKRFGVLRQAGLPPLETEDDVEERKIRDYYKAKDAAREHDEIELSLELRKAFALGLDVSALSLDALEQLSEDLTVRVNHLLMSLTSGGFTEGASSAEEAITRRRTLKKDLEALRKKRDAVRAIAAVRRRLPPPK